MRRKTKTKKRGAATPEAVDALFSWGPSSWGCFLSSAARRRGECSARRHILRAGVISHNNLNNQKNDAVFSCFQDTTQIQVVGTAEQEAAECAHRN
jgi:hypothetical protein